MAFTTEDCPMVQKGRTSIGHENGGQVSGVPSKWLGQRCFTFLLFHVPPSIVVNDDDANIVCGSVDYTHYKTLVSNDIRTIRNHLLDTKHATDTFESSLQSTTESVPSSGTSSTISSSTTSADISPPLSSQVTNFNTTQHTISPTFTPAGKLATTHLKPSIVTTIVVTISIFLIVGAAVLSGTNGVIAQREREPSPSRRGYFKTSSDVVREKVVELERQEMQTRSRLRLNLTAESAARRLSENAVSTEAEPPDESAMQPQSDGGWGRVGEDADENGPPPQYE
ncbi:hypothetical protein R3P38DRAFT_3350036 [Favolaschia claudopus]|uniref:Uncharacterized protein n=1 Tax=Favolaschia claudopus TaxID=2862362 RepID=A0AAW0CNS6_9AGAR